MPLGVGFFLSVTIDRREDDLLCSAFRRTGTCLEFTAVAQDLFFTVNLDSCLWPFAAAMLVMVMVTTHDCIILKCRVLQ